MPLPVFTWPEPCAGDHDLHPHAHPPAGPRYRDMCSGRYWCRACWRWTGGEACEPGRIVPRDLAAA